MVCVGRGKVLTWFLVAAPKKDWSPSEWIANFLKDEHFYYDDGTYGDMYDDAITGSDGEPFGDEFDDEGVLDSLIILGLAAVIVFLIYYRQQRQRAHRQAEEEAAARAGLVPPPMPQPGAPGDPHFQPWGVGGLGH